MVLFTTQRPLDLLVDYLPVRSAIRDLRSDQHSFDLAVNPTMADASPPLGTRRMRISLMPASPGAELNGIYCAQSEHGMASVAQIVNGAGHRPTTLKKVKCLPDGWLEQSSGLPYIGGATTLEAVSFRRHKVRLAVFLPCLGYGDAMATVSALRELKYRLDGQNHHCSLHAFVNPCQDPDVFHLATTFDSVQSFPVQLLDLATFDAIVDMNGIPMERDKSLVDSVLARLSIDPAAVPNVRKGLDLGRRGAPPEAIVARFEQERRRFSRLILLSPFASNPMRSMPEAALMRFLAEAPPSWGFICAMPGVVGNRVIDITDISVTFTDFIHATSLCDGVVSVDTSTMYVAAALGLPASIFFTNNRGDIWAAPYDSLRPIQVGEPGPLASLHASNDPKLVAYAHSQWKDLNFGVICNELASRIAARSAINADA